MSVSCWFRDQLVGGGHDFYTASDPRPSRSDGKPASKSVWNCSDDEDDKFIHYMKEWTQQRPQRISVDTNVPRGVRPHAIVYAESAASGKERADERADDYASDDDSIWYDRRDWTVMPSNKLYSSLSSQSPTQKVTAERTVVNESRPDIAQQSNDGGRESMHSNGVKNKFSMKTVKEKMQPPERDFENFEDFKHELDFTLNSKYGGYTNVDELANDFQADTGVSVAKMARRYGFSNFEALLRSNMLRTVVRMERDAKDRIHYLPYSNPRIEHIREAQVASQIGIEEMNYKWERQRLSRIYQPGVQELLLEGRMRLVKLAGDLGAERRYVEKKEICDRYQAEYGTQLNKNELRRLFCHPSLLHIFAAVCAEEFEVNQEESYDGRIYVKLRQPLDELDRLHAEWKERLVNGQSIVQHQKMPKKPKTPLNEQTLTFVPILPNVPL